ncbi:hypothetical protein BGX28_005335 [Mortierella sp. GBA30]|nr:hypothetical protein BGX28_005335 [Mortierella sp. GBA30]
MEHPQSARLHTTSTSSASVLAPHSTFPAEDTQSIDKKSAFKDMLRQRQAEVRTHRASSAALSDARSRRSTTTAGYSGDRGYHYSSADYVEGQHRGLTLQSLREEATRHDIRHPYQGHGVPSAGIVLRGPEPRHNQEVRQDANGGIVIRGPEALGWQGQPPNGSQEYTQRWQQDQRMERAPYGYIEQHQERRVSQEAQDLRELLLHRHPSGSTGTQDHQFRPDVSAVVDNGKARTPASTMTRPTTLRTTEQGVLQAANPTASSPAEQSAPAPQRTEELSAGAISFRSREADTKFTSVEIRPPRQSLQPSAKLSATPPGHSEPARLSAQPSDPATPSSSSIKLSVYNTPSGNSKNTGTTQPPEPLPMSTKFSNKAASSPTFSGPRPTLKLTVENSNNSKQSNGSQANNTTQPLSPSTKFSGPAAKSTANTHDLPRTPALETGGQTMPGISTKDENMKQNVTSAANKEEKASGPSNSDNSTRGRQSNLVLSTSRRVHPDPDNQKQQQQQAPKRARVGGDSNESVAGLSLDAIREERASKDPKLAKKMEEAEKTRARLEELTKAREMAMEVIRARERASGLSTGREPEKAPAAGSDLLPGRGGERGYERRDERRSDRYGDRRSDRNYDRYADRNPYSDSSSTYDRRNDRGYDRYERYEREADSGREKGSETVQDKGRERGSDRDVIPARELTEKLQDRSRERIGARERGRDSGSPRAAASSTTVDPGSKAPSKPTASDDGPVLFAAASRMQAKAESASDQQLSSEKLTVATSQEDEAPIIFSSAGRAQQQQQQQEQEQEPEQQEQKQQQESTSHMDVDVGKVKDESPILFSSASRLQQNLGSPILFSAASRLNSQRSPAATAFSDTLNAQAPASMSPFMIGSSSAAPQAMARLDFATNDRPHVSPYFNSNGLNMVSTVHGDVGRSDMSLAFEIIDRCTIDLQQLQQRHAALTAQLSEATFKALESDARLAQLAAQMELEMKMNHIHQELKRGLELKQLPEIQRMIQATQEMILRLSQLSASAAAGSATAVVIAPKLGSIGKLSPRGEEAGSGSGAGLVSSSSSSSATSPAALALAKLAESGQSLDGTKKRKADFEVNGGSTNTDSSGQEQQQETGTGSGADVERVLIRPCLSFNIAPKGCRFALNSSPCPYMHTCLYCGSVDHPVLQCDYTSVEPSHDGIFKHTQK